MFGADEGHVKQDLDERAACFALGNRVRAGAGVSKQINRDNLI
jgi:hypothetical protein